MRDESVQVSQVLAARVREAMRRANVGEDDLALETNIPPPRLRRILAGSSDSLTLFEIVAFATVLGQTIDSLLR